MSTSIPSTEAHELPDVCRAVNRARLVATATRLINVPSPTGDAGAVADELSRLLAELGFDVERPEAGHPRAPAVVVRFQTGRPGRCLQFNGHLDTVHLPFAPAALVEGRLTGSGAADMKAGIAAAVEALCAVRDAGALRGGSILLTAHDLHEAPWGDGRQLDTLIAEGYVGQAVLIPEYFNTALPIVGRGGLTWVVTIRRPGPPVHEVYRPAEPSVIAAGAELVRRIERLSMELEVERDPLAGAPSVFVGLIHSGSIYNEYPQTCRLEGTRRWLPGTRFAAADTQFRDLCAQLASDTGLEVNVETRLIRDAFRLDPAAPFARLFQDVYAERAGAPLPHGGKPFVDDGNSFWAARGLPVITHGPTAGGAHTTSEWVLVDDLVRVAQLYALLAVRFCSEPESAPAQN